VKRKWHKKRGKNDVRGRKGQNGERRHQSTKGGGGGKSTLRQLYETRGGGENGWEVVGLREEGGKKASGERGRESKKEGYDCKVLPRQF